MKAHTEYLTLHTDKLRELVHLTPRLTREFDGQRDKRLIVKVMGE